MPAVENPLCFAEPPWHLHLAGAGGPRGRNPSRGTTKKLRSRSSPVRPGASLLGGPRRRQRSPSASASSHSPHRVPSPFADLDDSCCHYFQDSEDRFKPAYFCKWPPAEPLRVVVVPGDVPCLLSSLITPTLMLPPAPYTDASPSPPPRTVHHSRVRKRQNGGRRASRHLVHGLLSDLTDNLPLAPPVPLPSPTEYGTQNQTSYVEDVISHKEATKTLSPMKQRRRPRERSTSKTCYAKLVIEDCGLPDGTEKVQDDINKIIDEIKTNQAPDDVKKVSDDTKRNAPLVSKAPIGPSSGVCRNVAVQARTSSRIPRRSKDAGGGVATSEPQTETAAAPAEVWIGDVRALRDSHVRLVRRQLRHIAQLNRALDHAGRYPQATETGHPTGPVQQTQPAPPTIPVQEAHVAQPATSSPTRQTLCSQSSSQPIPCSPTKEKSRRSSQPKPTRPHSRSHRTREE